jgi:glycosyltransferase involved in cell wall biosynthesis
MDAAKRRVVLILGMHRSGTSAVARVVNFLGAALPKNLLAAAPGNEAGHWEPIELVSLHDRMLAEAGSKWEDFRPFNIDNLPEDRIQFYRREIKQLIVQEYADEPWFVLKDPRICRFPAFYLEIFQELGIEVLVVLTFRNPLSVIGSLAARDQMTEDYAGLLWLRHWLDAEAGTRQHQRAVVDYEMLIEKPASVVAELRNWLRRMGITPRADNDSDIIDFLNPALRHHVYSPIDLNADTRIVKWIKDAYQIAANSTLESQFEQAYDALDAIQREFSDASAFIADATFREFERRFPRLEDELWSARSKVTELEHGIDVWSTETKKLEVRNRELDDQLFSARSKVADLEHGIDVWSAQAKKLEGKITTELEPARLQLVSILASRSWRMTAPLRKIRTGISKAAGLLRLAHGNHRSRAVRLVNLRMKLGAVRQAIAYRSRTNSKAGRVLRPILAYRSRFISKKAQTAPKSALTNTHSEAALAPVADAPVPLNDTAMHVTPPVRVIAFYLPQFHPIPENDEFWGKGFTEWANVTRATPQFVGHYQPRLPSDLGFYDLRLVEVQRQQVELAKLYGIGGFCFYFYWFGGKQLLERPVEQYLANPDLNLPFCLCWANENWTRTWDGLESEVLIEQPHSLESDVRFIYSLDKYLRDPRYIRVRGKPLVVVYRPSILTSPAETAARWRSWCRENGIGEIFLAYVQSFDLGDPAEYGFDAAIEFPPNSMKCPRYSGDLTLLNPSFRGIVYDWQFLRRRSDSYSTPYYKLFRGVCPSWDNEARRPGRGGVMIGSSPEEYRAWLKNAIRDTSTRFEEPSERLVFVNAWNEWAEGAYLEPDHRYGYAYLQATRDALEDVVLDSNVVAASAPSHSGILVVGHDAHPHGAQFLALHMMRELRQAMRLDAECILLRDGPLLTDYRGAGPVHVLNGCDPQSRAVADLLSRLKARGFQTVISNTTASGRFVPVFKAAGFKVVSLVHELPHVLQTYESRGLMQDARCLASGSDKIVFAGKVVADGFQKYTGHQLPNAMIRPQGLYKRNRFRTQKEISAARALLRERLGLQSNVRIVLGVGFGDHRKGIDLFVEIGEQVMADRPDVVFIWVGSFEGKLKEDLFDRIRRSRYSNRYIFPGFSTDTDLFYAGSDIYALTSREDPFPSVLIEALNVGVPIVSFEKTGAFDSLISETGAGRLVTQFDLPTFAREIVRLLGDGDARLAMGRAGASVVKREFSFRKYVYDLLVLADAPVRRTSVIVPNFNYCRYLAERLDSITKQTVAPYEVIVLDDASTDRSVDWLSDNLERICPDAELITNEVRSGLVFAQWLAGIRRARGDYVWIAEADDLAQPEFLAEALRGFDHPNVVMSYCQSKQMAPDGAILCDDYLDYVSDVSATKWTTVYVNDGLDEIVTALSVKNTIPNVSGVVFKRDVLLEVLESMLPELKTYRVAGDWITYIEMLQRGRIAFSPKPLNLHRRHPSSVTLGSFNSSQLSEIMRVQKMVRTRFKPPACYIEKAHSYAEVLFKQFGLVNSDTPTISHHPVLRSFQNHETV